ARSASSSIGLSATARRTPPRPCSRRSLKRRGELVPAESRRPRIGHDRAASNERMPHPGPQTKRSRHTRVIKENAMSHAARRMLTLLIALGLAVSVAGWVAAQQPAPAQQPAAPAQPSAGAPQASDDQEDLTSDIALTRASIQLRRQAIVTSVMD